jgi:hypothetical protein
MKDQNYFIGVKYYFDIYYVRILLCYKQVEITFL